MSETSPASVRFTGPEEEQLVRYRALHKLAVLALLLGLASALTLIHPLLLFIPAAGAACALVALRTIRANPEEWTGASFAIAGLVLSLFFLGWGVGWSYTRPARIARQTEEFARDWLKLVQQNELYAAHQLRQPAASRAPMTSRLDDFYRSQSEDLLKGFEDFSSSRLVSALVKAGPDHPAESHGVARGQHSGSADSVTLRYRIPAVDGQPMWSFHLNVHRSVADGNQWQIGELDGNQGEVWPE